MDELDLTERTPRAFEDDHPAYNAEPPPLPRARAPRSSAIMAAPPPIPGARRKATLPPPVPSAARRGSGTLIVPPLPVPAQTVSLPAPRRSAVMRAASEPNLAPAKLVSFLPPPEALPERMPERMPERTPTMPRPALIEEEPHVARSPLPSFDIDIDTDDESETDDDPIEPPRPLELTTAAPKKSNTGMWIGAGVGASLVAGVLAVTLIGRSGPDVATTAAPPSSPPATAPVTAPVAAPLKQTPQTEVPIRSQPAGAMVTLISAGEATVIGKTPITATLDPRKQYDVVLAYRELPTKVAHVDPDHTVALDVDLMGGPPPAPPVAEVATPAAATEETPVPAPAPVKRRSTKPKAVAIAETPAPKPAAPKPAPAPKTVAAAPAAGNGILMVSAKPPCNIAIDGKPTRLVTPQRSISLPAGPHKITLTNTQSRIAKTLTITITAGKPTKLIQDFTAQVVNPF